MPTGTINEDEKPQVGTIVRSALEQGPDETDLAWGVFQQYRDIPMRPRPTYKKYAEIAGQSFITMRVWSAKYEWKKRLREFDQEVYFEENPQDEYVRKENIVKEEVADYEAMRSVWLTMLVRVKDSVNTPESDLDKAIFSLNNLALARQRIDVLGRRSLKMPVTYRGEDEKRTEEDKQIYLDAIEGPMTVVDRGQDEE